MSSRKHMGVLAILSLAFVVIGIQIWSTVHNAEQIERAVSELEALQDAQLVSEKSRQEVIALRIKNEMDSLFWGRLLGVLGPMITGFVALLGALMGLRNYLDSREKERLDRAAADLRAMLEQLADSEPRVRAMGVVGLQHFFVEDKEEYHLRALSALTATARMEDDQEVLRCIRIAAEMAVATLPSTVLRQVSWQYVNLAKADFGGRDLRALDLRDCTLEDAVLEGCDLEGATLINARLNGANLDGAKLTGANCDYADFAGATLRAATLAQASLMHAKVQEMDLDGANLEGALLDEQDTAWEKIRNWRRATFDPEVARRLLARLGPEPSGTRILMLMWEIPPFVAGGTWTACYHMVRNLRRRGSDVTVVVPWDGGEILPAPFGCEVRIVSLGIKLSSPSSPAATSAQRPRPQWSPYSAPPPYGFSDLWSPYSGQGARGHHQRGFHDPYGFFGEPERRFSPYGPYEAWLANPYSSPSRRNPLARSSIIHLSREFEHRLQRFAAKERFDVIHAQDWITFGAAEALSRRTGKPWVAHFHSTEAERRRGEENALIERIERSAVARADHVVTPSRVTAAVLAQRYEAPGPKVSVAPNVLSDEGAPPVGTGSFESKRVVFLGRFATQKGPDRFAALARELGRRGWPGELRAYGDGDGAAAEQLRRSGVVVEGHLPWDRRFESLEDASALVVPSRAEPFGMVVLEAMLVGVPVFYPADAGVAEVMESGARIDPSNASDMADRVVDLLSSFTAWAEAVERQTDELSRYRERGYESVLMALWDRLGEAAPGRGGSPVATPPEEAL